jgi:hypothetical protein
MTSKELAEQLREGAVALRWGEGTAPDPKLADCMEKAADRLEELDAEVVTCKVCNGHGKAWGANPNKPCEACGGAGKVRVKQVERST